MSDVLPDYTIQAFGPHDRLPPEAEELFALQLADSRRQLPLGQNAPWVFILICAVTISSGASTSRTESP
jgi:hypothetical protein